MVVVGVIGVKSLLWFVMVAACEARGTLSCTGIMSGCLLPSVKVPSLETAILVCGYTAFCKRLLMSGNVFGVWTRWALWVMLLVLWSVTMVNTSTTGLSVSFSPELSWPVEPNQELNWKLVCCPILRRSVLNLANVEGLFLLPCIVQLWNCHVQWMGYRQVQHRMKWRVPNIYINGRSRFPFWRFNWTRIVESAVKRNMDRTLCEVISLVYFQCWYHRI